MYISMIKTGESVKAVQVFKFSESPYVIQVGKLGEICVHMEKKEVEDLIIKLKKALNES